jgi:hypothetical protein
MDRDKLKKILNELLHDEIKHMIGDDDSDFKQHINQAVQAAIEELQNTLSGDPVLGQRHGTQSDALVFSSIQGAHIIGGNGNLVSTPKGSILDLSRKNAPWVKCSQEVEEWARAMGAYLNSGGKKISKLLEEADDTAGGYELVMMGYGAYYKEH